MPLFEQDKAALSENGTPQGAVLSPLLENVYFHPLDKYWAGRHLETKLVRYCDDFVVLIRQREPEPYLRSLKEFMAKLRLTLTTEKTRVVKAEEGFDFLGARLVLKATRRDRNRRFCCGFPSPKSMNSVWQKIREEVGREYQRSLEQKIERLNPILRSWANYFNWLNSAERFHKVERYVIQRLNRWRMRKQGRVRRSYEKLHGSDLFAMGLYRITGRIAHVD